MVSLVMMEKGNMAHIWVLRTTIYITTWSSQRQKRFWMRPRIGRTTTLELVRLVQCDFQLLDNETSHDNEAKLMTKLAPEWVQTSDPVIRSPARYRWTTAPAMFIDEQTINRILISDLQIPWIYIVDE